jgi:hypothetical protein
MGTFAPEKKLKPSRFNDLRDFFVRIVPASKPGRIIIPSSAGNRVREPVFGFRFSVSSKLGPVAGDGRKSGGEVWHASSNRPKRPGQAKPDIPIP